MLGRRKRNRYKFTEKKQSKRGIAALVVAILIEIVYIVFLNAAFRGDGNLSMYYGSAGILMLGISLADFGFAIRSLFDEESFMTFPRLAVFFALIAVLSWVGHMLSALLFSASYSCVLTIQHYINSAIKLS